MARIESGKMVVEERAEAIGLVVEEMRTYSSRVHKKRISYLQRV